MLVYDQEPEWQPAKWKHSSRSSAANQPHPTVSPPSSTVHLKSAMCPRLIIIIGESKLEYSLGSACGDQEFVIQQLHRKCARGDRNDCESRHIVSQGSPLFDAEQQQLLCTS
jgi:hypothetical protein